MIKKTDYICIEAGELANELNFVAGVVYVTKPGHQFQYVMPEYTGDYWICDCVPCDRNGNPLDGYVVGVPVYAEDILCPVWDE